VLEDRLSNTEQAQLHNLTEREQDIMWLLAQDMTSKEIGT